MGPTRFALALEVWEKALFKRNSFRGLLLIGIFLFNALESIMDKANGVIWRLFPVAPFFVIGYI